jgi:hypothetical protein
VSLTAPKKNAIFASILQNKGNISNTPFKPEKLKISVESTYSTFFLSQKTNQTSSTYADNAKFKLGIYDTNDSLIMENTLYWRGEQYFDNPSLSALSTISGIKYKNGKVEFAVGLYNPILQPPGNIAGGFKAKTKYYLKVTDIGFTASIPNTDLTLTALSAVSKNVYFRTNEFKGPKNSISVHAHRYGKLNTDGTGGAYLDVTIKSMAAKHWIPKFPDYAENFGCYFGIKDYTSYFINWYGTLNINTPAVTNVTVPTAGEVNFQYHLHPPGGGVLIFPEITYGVYAYDPGSYVVLSGTTIPIPSAINTTEFTVLSNKAASNNLHVSALNPRGSNTSLSGQMVNFDFYVKSTYAAAMSVVDTTNSAIRLYDFLFTVTSAASAAPIILSQAIEWNSNDEVFGTGGTAAQIVARRTDSTAVIVRLSATNQVFVSGGSYKVQVSPTGGDSSPWPKYGNNGVARFTMH